MARALAYALHGFALFGVLVFGVLLLGAAAIPVLVLLVGLVVLTRWLFRRGQLGLGVLVAVAAQGAAFGGIFVVAAVEERRACDGDERRVLDTFPHPGGARPGVAGDPERAGCIVRLRAAGTSARVLAGYERELQSRGWRVLGANTYDDDPPTGELVAARGDKRFYVFWTEEEGATRLAVTVGD